MYIDLVIPAHEKDINTLNIIGEYDGFISYNKLLDQIYYNINIYYTSFNNFLI